MHGQLDENENTDDSNGADDAEVDRIFTRRAEVKMEIKIALFTKKLVSFEL
jgi:predicted HTH domain antitoxin